MPIYEYACEKCGVSRDEMRTIAERDDAPTCECGLKMERVLCAPAFGGDLDNTGWRQGVSGWDEGLGCYVRDTADRKKIMERKGLTEWNPDSTHKKMIEESQYIRKHGRGREATRAVQEVGEKVIRDHRKAVVKEKFRPVRDAINEVC
jgi:putative FmdB family regulatory protein